MNENWKHAREKSLKLSFYDNMMWCMDSRSNPRRGPGPQDTPSREAGGARDGKRCTRGYAGGRSGSWRACRSIVRWRRFCGYRALRPPWCWGANKHARTNDHRLVVLTHSESMHRWETIPNNLYSIHSYCSKAMIIITIYMLFVSSLLYNRVKTTLLRFNIPKFMKYSLYNYYVPTTYNIIQLA